MSRTSKITALYERLSRDDDLAGESNSMLKDGEMLANDCEAKLEEAGFKKSTIKKAKKKAGVVSHKKGFLWYWSLPMGDMPRA